MPSSDGKREGWQKRASATSVLKKRTSGMVFLPVSGLKPREPSAEAG